jgi:hypothetical protein
MLVVVMLVLNDAPFRCNPNISHLFLSGMHSLPLSISTVSLVQDSQEGIGDKLTEARGEEDGNVSDPSGRDAFLS